MILMKGPDMRTGPNKYNSGGSRFPFGGRAPDELSRFLLTAAFLPLLVSLFTRKLAGGYVSFALFITAMLLILWSVWRIFSSDTAARANENRHFTSGSFYTSLRDWAVRFSQRKEYRFFRCPGCGRWLRVPRGRGTLEIRCPGCGSVFRKKT